MKALDIESYVESQASIVRECFSSIVGSDSEVIKSFAEDAAKRLALDTFKVNRVKTSVTNPISSIHQFAVSELTTLAQVESTRQSKSLKGVLLRPFHGVLLRFVADLLDFDPEAMTDRSKSLQIGDSIFLAGIFLLLSEN